MFDGRTICDDTNAMLLRQPLSLRETGACSRRKITTATLAGSYFRIGINAQLIDKFGSRLSRTKIILTELHMTAGSRVRASF